MPTRLVVMLHRRRSARAGVDAVAEAPTKAAMEARRVPAATAALSQPRASADEDDSAVIDVGSCRSRGDEVAQSLKESCRIVVTEEGARIKTEAPGPRKGGLIDERAGRVGGGAAAAIRAVRIGRDGRDVLG